MENRDRTRDQGGRQPGSDNDGDNTPSDPRRTREQEHDDNNRGNPNKPRPDQSPRTA
jgi:hypothetical protein